MAGAGQIYGQDIYRMSEPTNECMHRREDELYGGARSQCGCEQSTWKKSGYSQSIWLTLREDVDFGFVFFFFTPISSVFITIYFLKRRSGQYQNKAYRCVFNYLFQGCTGKANEASSNLSSKQKHLVCFPWKRWMEHIKLILIRVEF